LICAKASEETFLGYHCCSLPHADKVAQQVVGRKTAVGPQKLHFVAAGGGDSKTLAAIAVPRIAGPECDVRILNHAVDGAGVGLNRTYALYRQPRLGDGEVNQVLLRQIQVASGQPSGFFSVTVPTYQWLSLPTDVQVVMYVDDPGLLHPTPVQVTQRYTDITDWGDQPGYPNLLQNCVAVPNFMVL
jgi:hypothetical protein